MSNQIQFQNLSNSRRGLKTNFSELPVASPYPVRKALGAFHVLDQKGNCHQPKVLYRNYVSFSAIGWFRLWWFPLLLLDERWLSWLVFQRASVLSIGIWDNGPQMVPLRLNRAFVAGKVVDQFVDAVARTDPTTKWQHEEKTIGSEWVLSTYHIRLHDGNLVLMSVRSSDLFRQCARDLCWPRAFELPLRARLHDSTWSPSRSCYHAFHRHFLR
jgi:hypothetical protein